MTRSLRYSINVTLDGCCDHRAIIPDEDLHRHAVENLAQADALLFGRVTYEMMEAAWRRSAPAGARPDWTEPFARTIDAAKKYVVLQFLRTVVIDDGLLLRMLSQLLRNRDRAARVPLHIHTLAEQGDGALMGIGAEVMQSLDAVSATAGTHLAFRCNDGAVNRASSQQEQQRCRAWLGAAYDGSPAEPLRSDIPGLITVGEFDRLVTRAARLLAAGLSRVHLVILPWEGHTWTAACAPHMAAAFFEAPQRAPDTTCLDSIPPLEFVVERHERLRH